MPETIAQLEAQRYTHISCWCEPCHRTVWVPFKMIRRDHPKLDLDNMTIAELGKRMPCGNCGAPGTTYKEARQEDGPGFQKYYNGRGGSII